MNCPKCGKPATLKNVIRPTTTAIGIGTGGYVASTGASTGVAIGSVFGPLGALAGGLLGILIGAAAGGAAGHAVGKYIDEGVIRVYHCDFCNHTWRAA